MTTNAGQTAEALFLSKPRGFSPRSVAGDIVVFCRTTLRGLKPGGWDRNGERNEAIECAGAATYHGRPARGRAGFHNRLVKYASPSRGRYSSAAPALRTGFTLIEILVVVVIILLMLGMAVPVLHVITGSQSEAGATNMIASMLGRARTDAIGLQKPIGVAFIYNPSTQVQTMAEVEFPNCPQFTYGTPVVNGSYAQRTSGALSYYWQWNGQNTSTPTQPGTAYPASLNKNVGNWYPVGGPPLEMRVDTDLQPLPAGVAVQTVSNCSYNNGVRATDGYLSIGVILFDGKGRLTSLPYGICANSRLAIASGLNAAYPAVSNVGIYNASNQLVQYGVNSQFGLVVFQRNAFASQGFPQVDPTYLYPTAQLASYYTQQVDGSSQTKAQEDNWLDQNSTPLLINRYTGTLIRAE
jgi:prepilin-type N-terminal cleavage/methylation domain-containing protein